MHACMHKYFGRFNFDPAGPNENERQKYSGRAEIEYDLFHMSFGSMQRRSAAEIIYSPRAGVRNDAWSKIHMNGEITCMHVYVPATK